LEPVNLAENAQVTLTIASASNGIGPDWLDSEFHAICAADDDPSITLDSVRAALAKIPGSMTDDFITERDER
jgi:hypothetical protein